MSWRKWWNGKDFGKLEFSAIKRKKNKQLVQYYYKDKKWIGPFSKEELIELGLAEDTLIWFPQLCPNGMKTPNECKHNKITYNRLKTKNSIKKMKKKFKRNIIFTKARLDGYFRYKDEFQIYPATYENLPLNKYATHFPVVVEYWINEYDNAEIPDKLKGIDEYLDLRETTNSTDKLRMICNLLSSITNHRFFFYSDSEGKWFINIPDDELSEENMQQSSKWGFSLYYYSNIAQDLKIDGFKTLEIPEIKPVDHFKYFLHDPIEQVKDVIQFPHSIHLILGGFFGLNKKERQVAESAAHLICNGIDLRATMKSISFLSFISSIETIVNLEYTEKNKKIEFVCNDCKTISSSPYTCHKCGRPIWGIAEKFRNFLSDFIHNSEGSIKKYKQIYNLRSKLVHNGALLLGDNYTDWGEPERPNSHWMKHIEAMQLSKLAFTNWLVHKRNEKIKITVENNG